MKILHVNSYYSGRSLYKNLYDQQVQSNMDIDVFVPVVNTYSRSSHDFEGYTTISPNYSNFDRLFFYLKQNKIYKDVIAKYRIRDYDVIHAHSLFTNGYVAMQLKKEFNIPYIVAVRNTDLNLFFKKMFFLRNTGLEILKNAKRIIFLSKSYRNTLINTYIPEGLRSTIYNKTSIIPNGIDNFWLNNINNSMKILKGKDLNLLFVGNIDKNKNITTTVEVIKKINKIGFNVKFTIVGEIKDRTVYNKIKNLDYINYIKPKPKEELLTVYQENDIFIMPSIHESFGLVYAEAMSQGLPVIYSKGQGFDMQFENGLIGYSVEARNANDIKEKLLLVIENYEFLSRNCIKYSHDFNWRKISNNYTSIYKECINYN